MRGLAAATWRRATGGQQEPPPSTEVADEADDGASGQGTPPAAPSAAGFTGSRGEAERLREEADACQLGHGTAAELPPQRAAGFPTLPSAIAAQRRGDVAHRGGTFGSSHGDDGRADGADALSEGEPLAGHARPAPPPMQPSPCAAAASNGRGAKPLLQPAELSPPPQGALEAAGPAALLRRTLSGIASGLVGRGPTPGAAPTAPAVKPAFQPEAASLVSKEGPEGAAAAGEPAALAGSARDDLRELAGLAARQRRVAARLGSRWLRDPFSALIGRPALASLQLDWWGAQAAVWRPMEVLLGRAALVGVATEQINERFLMAGHPNVHQQFSDHPALAPTALLAVALLGSLGARLGDGLGAARRAVGRAGGGGSEGP